MLNEIITQLINTLNDNIDERDFGSPYFDENQYEIFPFGKDGFHKIDKTSTKRTIFIDGGNQELLGGPNFSIQLNRIYFNIFQGNKRTIQEKLPHKIEFLSTTFSRLKNNHICYETMIFALNKEWQDFLPSTSDLSFNSKNRTVFIGTMRDDIQRVASISRRFAEWNYSRIIIENLLQENDIMVTDGTLQTAFSNEDKYLNAAKKIAIEKGVVFSGLSKSSSLHTTTGLPLLSCIMKMAEEINLDFDTWCYYPLAEGLVSNHSASIYVLKLHDKSNYVFRYEIDKVQGKSMTESTLHDIFNNLAGTSTDISFPGYPYGLIDADFHASVKNSEIETYRVMLLSQISKLNLWPKFYRYIRSSDAHNILNLLRSGF